jgi:uncharacterized membrane protein
LSDETQTSDFRSTVITTGTLVVVMFVAACWTLMRVPAGSQIPIHFGLQGAPNGWAPAPVGLFLLPVAGALLWTSRVVLPRIDPRGRNLVRSGKAYGTIWMASTVVLMLLEGQIIATALGSNVPRLQLVTALIGGFLAIVGNVLGKLRWNYTVGIRTPWTLSNERVWDQTHRFAGWAFVIGGVVLLVSAFAPSPGALRLPIIVAVVLAITVSAWAKSYLLWRHRAP